MIERTIRLDRRAPHVWLIALAAAFTLLQPALGALSPSLAGWNPNHSHVFTTEAAAVTGEHHHPYDAHSHDPHEEAPATGETDGGADDEGVLFTSSGSVAGTALAAVAVAVIQQPGVFSRTIGVTSPVPTGLVLTPRPRPPRA
jgi:hypothetical protein